MTLDSLFAPFTLAEFLGNYFHCLPYCRSQAALEFQSLGTWTTLDEILKSPGADVLVVRDGSPCPGAAPCDREAAEALTRDGCTVLVRHAEQCHGGLARLAEAFRAAFRAPIDVHVYATPPGRHGFGWHYDAEDVFIIQTSGVKEYGLRKNTVHPWPLVESLPADMGYPREIMPLQRVTLSAGDWLYIPCGYWHKATALTSPETAISLAVGVLSPAAVGVLDFARRYLTSSLIWRQRLPVAANGRTEAELDSLYAELFDRLARDLSETLRDPRFRQAYLAEVFVSSCERDAEAVSTTSAT
ncbi:MAG: cupin domain-containing protein [Pirellulaceae bacterium]